MRFNDLLRTVLANSSDGAYAVVTRWRQCIDLLAQYDVSGAPPAQALGEEDRAHILSVIDAMRPRLSVEQRVAAVVELGGRLRSPGLVGLLAQDHPALVAATMNAARLSDADWAALVPELGPLARSVLRRRTALGPLARQMLDRFGPVDFALPAGTVTVEAEAPAPPVADQGPSLAEALAASETPGEPSQIGRIVAQIERFTGSRDSQRNPASRTEAAAEAQVPIDCFAFEADVTGRMMLVSGAPHAAAHGLSIGAACVDSRLGADGTALGAFRRRAAFSHARFTIGEGVLQGEWRISGEPRFDSASGRFTGYVGSARREQVHESMVRSAPEGWVGLSAQGARQLIHELRTPLNAIQGFAEMIDAQLFGPVTSDYREMARNILTDARTLITTFDDLDLASRLERGDAGHAADAQDLEGIVRQVVEPFMTDGGRHILFETRGALPPVAGHRAQIERMLSHLLRAGCTALDDGEALVLRLSADTGAASVRLAMRRPRSLVGMTEAQLFDHGAMQDQRWGAVPPLGLAFTLRLVRGIAAHVGGRFELTSDLFSIVLPAARTIDSGQEGRR